MTMIYAVLWATGAVTSFTLSSLIAGGKIAQFSEFNVVGYQIQYANLSLTIWALICGALLSGPGVYMFNKAMLANKEFAVSTMIVLGPLSGLVLAYFFGTNVNKPIVWVIAACIVFLGLMLEYVLKG